MTILYIAYSCSAYHGSEDKIGWNIPMESAKTNRVFIITKEEQRQFIERYLQENPNLNIRVFYADIPSFYKKLFAGHLYSGRINVWNKEAFKVAKKICKTHHIDVIHQITPVEFRSVGDYGKIPNIKFVCGPLGGAESIPKGLTSYAANHFHLEIIRALANWWYRTKYLLNGKLHTCSLLFANHETAKYLTTVSKIGCPEVSAEIGISESDIIAEPNNCQTQKLKLLVIGRLVYRKGHALLLDALERIPENVDYECWIVGAGKERGKIQKRCQSHSGLSKKVVLKDAIPFEEVALLYDNADVCIVPSIRETTGSVILESMAHGVPVITINRFGGATILDEETGWLYDGNTKEEFIENLKNAIVSCIENPDEVRRRGLNARRRAEEYTWEKRMKQYQRIYDSLVNED